MQGTGVIFSGVNPAWKKNSSKPIKREGKQMALKQMETQLRDLFQHQKLGYRWLESIPPLVCIRRVTIAGDHPLSFMAGLPKGYEHSRLLMLSAYT
jgi:hypothetical protein